MRRTGGEYHEIAAFRKVKADTNAKFTVSSASRRLSDRDGERRDGDRIAFCCGGRLCGLFFEQRALDDETATKFDAREPSPDCRGRRVALRSVGSYCQLFKTIILKTKWGSVRLADRRS